MDECRAENCKAKHPHKRFCGHGHDTFECGQTAEGKCRECIRIRVTARARARGIPPKRSAQQIPCTVCEKPMTTYPTRTKKNHKFCSLACKGVAQRKSVCNRGHNRTPGGGTCQTCATHGVRMSDPEYRWKRLLKDQSTVDKAIEALDPRLKELFR